MTTKTDRARECAREIGKRFVGEWIAGPDMDELTKIITKHFPAEPIVKAGGSVVDAARNAANGIPWGDGTPEERIKRRQEYQDRIADAFRDFVPASSAEPMVQPEKLEHVHILAKQALVTGDPQELPESADDNDPRQHNCDAMGCPTLDHVLYRLPFTDHRKPIDTKALAKTLAESIDFTAGPVQARDLFEEKLKALIADATSLWGFSLLHK